MHDDDRGARQGVPDRLAGPVGSAGEVPVVRCGLKMKQARFQSSHRPCSFAPPVNALGGGRRAVAVSLKKVLSFSAIRRYKGASHIAWHVPQCVVGAAALRECGFARSSARYASAEAVRDIPRALFSGGLVRLRNGTDRPSRLLGFVTIVLFYSFSERT